MQKSKNDHIEDNDFIVVEINHNGNDCESFETVFSKDSINEVIEFVKNKKNEIMEQNLGKKMHLIADGDLYFEMKFGRRTYRLEVFSDAF